MRWWRAGGLVAVGLILGGAVRGSQHLPIAHAAPAQAEPLVTISGDVRAPLTLDATDFSWLPLSSYTRLCTPTEFDRYVGIDLEGLINAAGPLTADPAGYTVTAEGAGGQTVSIAGDALDPTLAAGRQQGPLLVMQLNNAPLPEDEGPVLLLSQSCDTTQDVPAVQTITVTLNGGAAAVAPSTSIDDRQGLTAAAIQPGDLPDLTLRYATTRATVSPDPQGLPALTYYGYWSSGATRAIESIYSYTDVADATQQMGNADPTGVLDDIGCDEDSLQILGAQGIGDEDAAYTYTCPSADGTAGDGIVVAVDQFRIGRAVATVSATMPAPADPRAEMLAIANAAAARLAAAAQ